MTDVLGVEAAILQEPALLRSFRERGRRTAELLAARGPGEIAKVASITGKQVSRKCLGDASLRQLGQDAARSEAAAGTLPNVGFGEPAVVLQPLVGERVECAPDLVLRRALRGQLSLQLETAVLPAGERGDGQLRGRPIAAVAQASASMDASSSSASAEACACADGMVSARIAASSSAASSTFSFR